MNPRAYLLSAVFTVGLFLLLASVSSTSSSSSAAAPSLAPFSAIITSPQTNTTFPARPAAFGPTLVLSDDSDDQPAVAFSGLLYVLDSHGCSVQAAPDLRDKIALVLRGECSFYEKVLNLQSWGASAVIVGDVEGSRGLLTMSAKGDTHKARIPSFFVSHASYEALALLDSVSIIPSQPPSPVLDTLLFLLLSPLLSLSLIYALLLFHRRYKRMRDRAPKAFVDSLPVRTWGVDSNPHEKVWGSSDECVICLEDYIPAISRVMRLPCGHEFHSSCM
ncbi:hypothetical protein BZA70DRAFT_48593 [Myxozyma melibiosi]|uniref:RING-type domain-containing protein n=1 Tax=Myxozyma melibiosi TaxID=54550 RepID=A0ABR1FF65_9ASCO